MYDAVELVKTAALEAVEASKPVCVAFGRVLSREPLKVQTDQKAVYGERSLIFTERMRSDALYPGDTVAMIGLRGGKRFLILDILKRHDTREGSE